MISVILPTIRPDGRDRCLAALKEHGGSVPYEVITEIDTDGIGCPKMVNRLAARAKYDWILFLADDTVPQAGLLDEIAKHMDRPGMVGLNDGIHDGNDLATHWCCHKDMLELTGGEFFHEGYLHTYCDNELSDIAKENGRYVWAEDARIEHRAQVFRGDKDESTKQAYLPNNKKHDLRLYLTRKEGRIGYQLGVGFPLTDAMVSAYFAYSLLLQDWPPYNLYWPKSKYYPTDLAKCRNDICANALRDYCTHILMLDTDQVYQDKDLARRLLAHKKDIVGGKVHRRWPPFDPILNRDGQHVPDEEIEAGGLIPVDSTGTGCLLIRTAVLVDLDYPWFQFERDEDDNVTAGEDITFCRKAKEKGFEIFVDADVNIDHMTTQYANQGMYAIWKRITTSSRRN
jgi:hypothetical protein